MQIEVYSLSLKYHLKDSISKLQSPRIIYNLSRFMMSLMGFERTMEVPDLIFSLLIVEVTSAGIGQCAEVVPQTDFL